MKSFALLSLCLLTAFLVNAQDVVLKKGKYYGPDGKPYTGTFKEYDEQGKLSAEHQILEGQSDGITLLFYPGGAKKEQRSYKAGKKDGLWINWAESGIKTAEARFTDGLKDGYWYVWDEKGNKRYEMFYALGEKKGKWIIWDEAGNIVTEQNYP